MATTLLPLNTGANIPALGFGTWQAPAGECRKAVLHALKAGYKHIDCAYVYGNEEEVGEAFKEAFDSGIVKREDLFVTTKLWCTWHQRAEQNLDTSLKRLGLTYVDLYVSCAICHLIPWVIINGDFQISDALALSYGRDARDRFPQISGWKPHSGGSKGLVSR